MNDPTYQLPTDNISPERVVTAGREASTSAPGRCVMYALCSDLAASPFDAEPAVAGKEVDISGLGLPYKLAGFQEVLDEWRHADREELKREYSGLFEVGSDGPPVPIREDLHRNQPAGVREDIVRFFEFFGYGLEESFAWAPDHLSVELEFMHFLIYQEAENTDVENAQSFQFAQHDFSQRHLYDWVPEMAERIRSQRPDSLYTRVIAVLSEFLQQDFNWQQSTISDQS
jgi:DMSO reductase family type II enzyme chaperone